MRSLARFIYTALVSPVIEQRQRAFNRWTDRLVSSAPRLRVPMQAPRSPIDLVPPSDIRSGSNGFHGRSREQGSVASWQRAV